MTTSQTAALARAAAVVPAHKFEEPTNVPFAAVAASQTVAVGRPTKVPPAMNQSAPIAVGASSQIGVRDARSYESPSSESQPAMTEVEDRWPS